MARLRPAGVAAFSEKEALFEKKEALFSQNEALFAQNAAPFHNRLDRMGSKARIRKQWQ